LIPLKLDPNVSRHDRLPASIRVEQLFHSLVIGNSWLAAFGLF
jgi:hypothetical protein